MKKRIVIVDDHTSVREMLGCVLSQPLNSLYEVVGEAGTGLEALKVCTAQRPDLVVLDLHMPEMSGSEVLRRLGSTLPRTRVLVYSGTGNQRLIIETLKLRPNGFVGKAESLHVLLEAITAVAVGGTYLTSFATGLLSDFQWGSGVADTLSSREREVLQMVAEGRSSKEIATCLSIAVKTVEHHREHLMTKLHVRDVASLTRCAVSLGLVSVE